MTGWPPSTTLPMAAMVWIGPRAGHTRIGPPSAIASRRPSGLSWAPSLALMSANGEMRFGPGATSSAARSASEV